MPEEIEKAKKALRQLENDWLTIIDEINQDKNRQMPQAEGNRIRKNGMDVWMQFIRLYTPEIDADRDLGLDVTTTSSRIFSRLDVSLLEGKRRYEREIHQRNIENLRAQGAFLNDIKFNVGSLLLGIIGTAAYYSFR